jgi:hypothetical protein
MAQMPIQLASGRAETYAPPPAYVRPPGAASQPPAAPPKVSQAFDPGAISGGVLRPGSIDQMTFRQRLEAAHRGGPVQHPAAGKSPLMLPPAGQGAPSIPSLTPAQLAALGVDISTLAPASAATDAPPPPSVLRQFPAAAPAHAPVAEAPTPEAAPAEAAAATDAAPETAPTPENEPAAAQQAALPPAAEDPDAPKAPVPGAHLAKDGVWELPRQPSKDEREWFQGMNAKWRIVENPESVKLFLGEDGKFGFDDFLDIINPLQHIPFVNMAYRALTGDEINGAAQMVGAVAMGPVSAASTIVDLAFKSETGEGLAANGIAMLFGGDEAPSDVASYATAAGNTQMAELPQIRRGSNR